VLSCWHDVDALQRTLEDLRDKAWPAAHGQGTLADRLTDVMGERAAMLAALKQGWDEGAEAMRQWLETRWSGPAAARKGLPAKGHATRWLDALAQWAQDPGAERPDVKSGADKLSASALRETLAALGRPATDVPEVFDRFEALMKALARLPEPAIAMRLHAAASVQARAQALKALAGTFGYADALRRLDEALDPAVHGERALRLRERIVERYPVAMVDEFQDTSPVQLRIFDRLYRIGDDDPQRTLLLIGDPKQAIYGFRGADIHSYLRARAATAGRHHALATNHRSTEALVRAVNGLFLGAERHAPEGAFLFGRGQGASPLPFVEVGARGRAQRLVGPDGVLPAVTLAADAAPRNATDSRRLHAAHCAQRIVEWLNEPAVGFVEDDKPFRRLRPADIAVLVQTRREADAVRAQLRRRGVASVYLSDKDSVFASAEAADLLRLMRAAAAPRDVRLARAALATGLLGLSLPELRALADDDAALDRRCASLQALGQTWKTRGILAMVRQLLHGFDLPARWLSGGVAADDAAGADAGERRLTNVLHLAELLQAAASHARTAPALIRWLQQRIDEADAGPESDEQVLRLESDADLVQVVTIHKSKGLEYPLVFLPFAAHFRPLGQPGQARRDRVVALPPADDGAGSGTGAGSGERVWVVGPDEAQWRLADKERQREQLRLLYVALTRARHLLWVGLADVRRGRAKQGLWADSAIGHLLAFPAGGPANDGNGAAPQAPERLPLDEARARSGPDLHVEAIGTPNDDRLPWPAMTRLRPRDGLAPLNPAPVYRARFERRWSVSSYSALVRDAGGAGTGRHAAGGRVAPDETPTRPLRDDEPDMPPRPASFPTATSADRHETGTDAAPWHRFPRGAHAGDFLHDQLEWLAGEAFALDRSAELQQRLARRCALQGWGAHADDVVTWLRAVCRQPLPALGTPLSALGTVLPEMEFWCPSDGLRCAELDSLCQTHLFPGRSRPALAPRTLQGMLMGYADLVFEHEGRHWVLDHKSNALGRQDRDYTAAAMEAAMLEHRYDVQAALYLLALHRLLRARLASAYRPPQHLGGAVYLFLRGVQSPTAGCCTLPAPLALMEALDALVPAGAQDPTWQTEAGVGGGDDADRCDAATSAPTKGSGAGEARMAASARSQASRAGR
ncbi:MAG: UvrD-helicase domain-containing protein, partial [Rubrivivax sp.]